MAEDDRSSSPLQRTADFLAANEIWPIALAIGVSMVLPRYLPVALGIAAIFWFPRWLSTGRVSVRTPADGGIFFLCLMIPVTLWATSLPGLTVPQVLRLLSGAALFYAIINWTGSLRRQRVLILGNIAVGLLLAISIPLVVNWSMTEKLPFLPASLYSSFPAQVSDTANPNVMAGFLALFFPVALAVPLFFWSNLDRLTRALSLFAAFTLSVALVLTVSRGALIATLVAICVLALLRWRFAWIALFLLGIGGIVALQPIGLKVFLDTLTTNPTLGGLEGRLEVWSRALYMTQDFPFTGVGMGSFTQVADTLYPFFLAAPGTIDHAHNLFLQIAVDLGIPGLIAWLSIWMLVISSAWGIYRLGRRTTSGWVTGVGAGLLASQIALGVHGLMDAVTWGQVRPAPLVWGLWGLTFASWNVFHRQTESPS